jgi:hypothetical protein
VVCARRVLAVVSVAVATSVSSVGFIDPPVCRG